MGKVERKSEVIRVNTFLEEPAEMCTDWGTGRRFNVDHSAV